MIELLNVESAKSCKITADEACRGVSVYTPLSLRDWVRASPRHFPKGVALHATPLPRIDLLRRFVSACFFRLSHPGCDNTQQGVAQMCHDGLDLNQR